MASLDLCHVLYGDSTIEVVRLDATTGMDGERKALRKDVGMLRKARRDRRKSVVDGLDRGKKHGVRVEWTRGGLEESTEGKLCLGCKVFYIGLWFIGCSVTCKNSVGAAAAGDNDEDSGV